MEYYSTTKNNVILSFAVMDGIGEHHVRWNKPDSVSCGNNNNNQNNKKKTLKVEDRLITRDREG